MGPNGITLVGIRTYSSPLCQPLTGTGCPVDGIPVFSNIFTENTVAHSNYNSLQVMLEKHSVMVCNSRPLIRTASPWTMLRVLKAVESRAISTQPTVHRCLMLAIVLYSTMCGHFLCRSLMDSKGNCSMVGRSPGSSRSRQDSRSASRLRMTTNEYYSTFFEAPGEPNWNTGAGYTAGSLVKWNPKTHGGYAFDPNQFDNCNNVNCPKDPSAVQLGTIGNAPRSICCRRESTTGTWAYSRDSNSMNGCAWNSVVSSTTSGTTHSSTA